MKKLMMMAVMAVASTTAFAADSEALKAILKAKTYAEAEALVNSSLDQLANDQEKAKAYNKLVDLSYEVFKKEDDTRITNMALQKNDPVDTEGMVKAGIQALNAALECDKYDILPDAKGKVKPAFQKKNQDRLLGVRNGLLSAGFDFAQNNKSQEAYDALNPYFLTAEAPLFKDLEVVKNDANRGAAAYYAGRAAVLLENIERGAELLKIGVQDTAKQVHDYSFNLLIDAMGLQRKTAEDSVKYLNDMKELYAQYPENEAVYIALTEAYFAKDNNDEVARLADDRIARMPQSSFPYLYKGYIKMIEKDYDAAIAEYSLVKDDSPIFLQAVYNRAVCKYNKATDFNEANADMRTGELTPENKKIYLSYIEEAKKDFEKAQELDPDQLNVKWGYLLKNTYLLTGEQDKADAIL